MALHKILHNNMEQIIALFSRYDVERVYAFGSVVGDSFKETESDIDLIVEMASIPPLEKEEQLLSLWNAHEALLGRDVDLLTEKAIKNPYLRSSIERTKELIYDRAGQKVSI